MTDYAILDADASQVVEVRSFASPLPSGDIRKGADGLPLARPITDVKPALQAGERYAAAVTYVIKAAGVDRVFTPEALPVPEVVSMAKAQIVLDAAGLLPQVETAVGASPKRVQIAWGKATEIHRNSSTMLALAAALGLTEAQVDDLFRQAEAVTI